MPLTQKRGAVDISWVFSNGELCSANQVQSRSKSAFLTRPRPSFLRRNSSSPTRAIHTSSRQQNVQLVRTPSRLELNGILVGDLIAGPHYVYIYGLNEAGEKVAKGMLEAEVDLATVFDGKVTFVPCESDEYPTMSCE